MSVFGSLSALLAQLAEALHPVFGDSATGVTIVLFTLCVRLALHPLVRAAARGEKSRAALAPQLAELKRRHGRDPERLRREAAELYAKAGASPLAGWLPALLQLPVFVVLYRLFSGQGSDLLDHALFGAPLGGRWSDALADGGVFGAQGLVYVGLFAVIAAVASWTYARARKARAGTTAADGVPGVAGMATVLALLPFGTLVTAAVVPLAAGLYLATTTAWAAAERAWLQRGDESGKGRDELPTGK